MWRPVTTTLLLFSLTLVDEVQSEQLRTLAHPALKTLLSLEGRQGTLPSLLSRDSQWSFTAGPASQQLGVSYSTAAADQAGNLAAVVPAAAANTSAGSAADDVRTPLLNWAFSKVSAKPCSWLVVYTLCILLLIALTPVLVKFGTVPFITLVLYLTSSTATKLFVRLVLKGGMPFPYSITAVQMLVTLVVTASPDRPKRDEMMRVLPIAVVNGAAQALKNTSLVFGGVAFVAMLSCCTPAMTWALQVLSGRLTPVWHDVIAVSAVVLGGMLCVKGETSFSFAAMVLTLAFSACRSCKCLWQFDLLKVEVPPMHLVAWSSFWSLLMMLPLIAYYEGAGAIASLNSSSMKVESALGLIALVATKVLKGIVQCYSIKELGPLLPNVFGNLQVMLLITVASAWFEEDVSLMQWEGIALLVLGSVLVKGAKPGSSLLGPEKKHLKS